MWCYIEIFVIKGRTESIAHIFRHEGNKEEKRCRDGPNRWSESCGTYKSVKRKAQKIPV